jgi:metal-responsive CopG/Arc/MetJ family transcriptional regulator
MTEIIQTKFDKIIKENKLNKSAILRDLVSDFIDKYEIENQ